MRKRSVPRCPGCVAELPVRDPQEIVTCEFCGTDSNVVRGRIPPPEVPPAEFLDFASDDEPVERWSTENVLARFIADEDPAKQAEWARLLADRGSNAAFLVYAPVVAERMPGATPEVDAALGKFLHSIAWYGGAKGRRQVLTVGERLAFDPPGSRGLLHAMSAAKAGAIKTMLDIAQNAEVKGDLDYAKASLEHVRGIVDYEEGHNLDVCVDILLYRITFVTPFVRDWIVDYLGDCLDGEYAVPLPGPRDHKDFDFLLVPVLLLLDDLAHEDPPLAKRLASAIANGYSYRKKNEHDMERWIEAIKQVPSAEGREAAVELFYRVYPRDADYPVPPETLDGLLPPLTDEADEPFTVAVTTDGRAACPGCGRPLPLTSGDAMVTCGNCGRRSRLEREVREVEREVRERKDDQFDTWPPEKLLAALLSEKSADRRRKIAEAMDAPDADGRRYAPLAGDLVKFMMVQEDSDVDISLQGALERMMANGGPAFREAFVAAVREHGFAGDGSGRLLDVLGQLGPSMASLLLDLAVHAAAAGGVGYMSSALQQFGAVLQHAAEREDGDGELLPLIDHLLARLPELPEEVADGVTGPLGMLFHHRPRCGEAHLRILRFVDERTDPSKTHWLGELYFGPRAASQTPYLPDGPRHLLTLQTGPADHWPPPPDRDDLFARLAAIDAMRTSEVKLLIVLSLRERWGEEPPKDLREEDHEAVRAALDSLRADPHLKAACDHAIDVLCGGRSKQEPEQAGVGDADRATSATKAFDRRGWWSRLWSR